MDSKAMFFIVKIGWMVIHVDAKAQGYSDVGYGKYLIFTERKGMKGDRM